MDTKSSDLLKLQGNTSADFECIVSMVQCTVDREIFTLKIIRAKNFRVIKFSHFPSIREILLRVDDCNTDKLLESSWRLVYYCRYQESQGSLAVVFDWTFTPGMCRLVRKLIIAT